MVIWCIVQLFIGTCTFSFVVTHTYVLNNKVEDVCTGPAGRLVIALLLSTGKEASLGAEELCSRVAGSPMVFKLCLTQTLIL